MADRTGSRKPNKKGCSILKAYAADWMLSDNISIKDGGSCNVFVVVPYGYPVKMTMRRFWGHLSLICLIATRS